MKQRAADMTEAQIQEAVAKQEAKTNPLSVLLAPTPATSTPEFSVITCSVNDEKFKAMSQCYANALAGEAFEIVRISDAHSLAEGYIRGIEQAKGSRIIFSHDDAAPLRPIGAKLRAHLRRCDVIGGAGTDRLDGPAWFTSGHPHIFGQVLNQVPGQKDFLLSIYSVPGALVEKCQALDGFWMAANREVLHPMLAWFDKQTCDGFHAYDIDFSFGAFLRGVNVGVACDLNLCHASTGGYGDAKWKPAADKLMKKYAGRVADHVPGNFQFGAMTGPDMNRMVAIMDGLVERTR